jgi:hypothetical protein
MCRALDFREEIRPVAGESITKERADDPLFPNGSAI